MLPTVRTALAEAISRHCIVPVPLHTKRLKQRGYNQALELARPVARQMAIPLNTRLLQRIRTPPRQQGQSALEHSKNMHNAFSLTAEALGLNDLLIDDVMTTDKRLENVAGPCSSVAAEVQVAVVGRV